MTPVDAAISALVLTLFYIYPCYLPMYFLQIGR